MINDQNLVTKTVISFLAWCFKKIKPFELKIWLPAPSSLALNPNPFLGCSPQAQSAGFSIGFSGNLLIRLILKLFLLFILWFFITSSSRIDASVKDKFKCAQTELPCLDEKYSVKLCF